MEPSVGVVELAVEGPTYLPCFKTGGAALPHHCCATCAKRFGQGYSATNDIQSRRDGLSCETMCTLLGTTFNYNLKTFS